jgi:hypothetical protein
MSQVVDLPTAIVGRFLAYVTGEYQDLAMAVTASSSASGIVVRDSSPLDALRRSRASGYRPSVALDVGAWTTQVATPKSPTLLHAPGALMQISLDSWASDLLSAGAAAVLTPSKFVRAGNWAALQAVLDAGKETSLPGVLTLVATDAAMLNSSYLRVFSRALSGANRPLALLFAAKDKPLAGRGRAAALRKVMSVVPGCLLLAVEPITAADAFSYGASCAAIGLSGGLRRPRRPGDRGGGPNAKDFVPGLFLRDLWEHRSPGTYADWYANSPSPTCGACGGRALDEFGSDEADKEAVLRHNVHEWLGVHTEICDLDPVTRRLVLAEERADALAAHLNLRPATVRVEADPVLRQLVELDDPQGRRTTPQGAWH